ncbi:MAG: YdcF family protein [Bacteroidia bacterium]|nr:YdcF family protein [Bacteroidia bacterium]
MRTWIRIVLLALVGIVISLCVFILSVSSADPKNPVDIGIVMGTRVEADGKPSEKLALRLEKAYELFQSGQVSELWVTGGNGVSGHNEAGVMKEFLVAQGIPAEAIMTDSLGISTFASARNLSDALPPKATIAIISNTFHLRRTRFAFEQFGRKVDEVVGVSGGFSSIASETYGVLRECLALPYYWTREYL